MTQQLVVKVTCGAEAPERLSQGITVASTAVASGVDVSLWLTGDAVWLGVRGRVPDLELEFATPLTDLVESLLEGARVTLCTQCVKRRGITDAHVADGVRIAGAASFVEEITRDNVQVIVY
jgi:predicted peroxiredoxin